MISNNKLQQRVGIDPENLQIKCKLFYFRVFFVGNTGIPRKRAQKMICVYFQKKKLLLLDIILFLGVSPEKIGASAKV